MAAINVEKMPLKELVELNQRVQRAMVVAKERERSELKQKIAQMAENSGFSVGELFGARGPGRAGKSTGVAKYRNPDNSAETWTGRGRKPNWLVARLAKGANVDDFEI